MTRTPIHPGAHLAEELKELGISAAELARQIDVPVNRVTSIINGQWAITSSAEFWLNLQKLYELRLARQEVGDRIDRLPRRLNHKRKKKEITRLTRSENAVGNRSQTRLEIRKPRSAAVMRHGHLGL